MWLLVAALLLPISHTSTPGGFSGSRAVPLSGSLPARAGSQVGTAPSQKRGGPDTTGLRLHHVQVLGSHNSYKAAIDSSLMRLLRERRPELAQALEYAHPPLDEQLDVGLRNLELDVYRDPEGGRYAEPHGRRLVKKAGLPSGPPYDPEGLMKQPGFKVLHIQDLDFRSNCLTFRRCLRTVKRWSDAHPDHLPIVITLNAKDDTLDLPQATPPLPFNAAAFDALDAAIWDVFSREGVLQPDDVRRGHETLEGAVRTGAWPRLQEVRGTVLFVLDQSGRKLDAYRRDHPSLRGRAMFADAPRGTPEAAVHIVNDPVEAGDRIQSLVEAGYLVRTRADANTIEARRNNSRRQAAAFQSGAHVVTTDYFRPDPAMGTDYEVTLPGGEPGRCNPVSAPPGCTRDQVVGTQ